MHFVASTKCISINFWLTNANIYSVRRVNHKRKSSGARGGGSIGPLKKLSYYIFYCYLINFISIINYYN